MKRRPALASGRAAFPLARLARCLVCGLAIALATSAQAQTRALVVAGLGGTADYETAFQRHAKQAADRLRVVADDVTLLLGEMVSRQRLAEELAGLGRRASAGDAVLVLLIGHGSFDDRDYRFNLPGPDVTGAELAAWLDGLPADNQLVVAATSASGALQPLLAGGSRTVMTATRSGSEANASVFAGYFVAALGDQEADLDKDGYVSSAEAFGYAEDRVAGHYAQRNQMASEHPVAQGAAPALRLARLQDAPGSARGSEPWAAATRVAELESAIAALRAARDGLDSDTYYAELQRLLLELAMLRRTRSQEQAP